MPTNKTKYPIKLKKGACHVSITKLGDGRYCVYWQSRGRQVRRIRMTEEKARYFAKDQLMRMSVGVMEPVTSWPECIEIASKFDMTPVQALREWLDMKSKDAIESIPLQEAIEKFLLTKRKQNVGERHLKDLKLRLAVLNKHASQEMSQIDHKELQVILDGLNVAPKTMKNYRDCWKNLFNWAKSEGYLSLEWRGINRVVLPATRHSGKVTIYTPQELEELIAGAPEKVKPFIAIGAWAGLRTAEINRLSWDDISDTHITVQAEKAKTATRRIVPILGPLNKYLDRDYRKPQPLQQVHYAIRNSGIAKLFKPNALRHSFISYRLAILKSADHVALEAGNSPSIIFSNYLELVTEKDAKKWFGNRNLGDT